MNDFANVSLIMYSLGRAVMHGSGALGRAPHTTLAAGIKRIGCKP